ncbi:MAG TPA: hypothetical protein VF992_04055 [Thermoplasmata archaeon]
MAFPRALPLLVAGCIVLVAAVAAWFPHPAVWISVRAGRTVYAPGEPVNFTATLVVGGNRPVTVPDGPGGPGCGIYFIVEDESHAQIYPGDGGLRSCPLMFARLLPPGETRSWNFTWLQVNASGSPVPAERTYWLVAELFTSRDIQVIVAPAGIFVGMGGMSSSG